MQSRLATQLPAVYQRDAQLKFQSFVGQISCELFRYLVHSSTHAFQLCKAGRFIDGSRDIKHEFGSVGFGGREEGVERVG